MTTSMDFIKEHQNKCEIPVKQIGLLVKSTEI
jgi:hypothetical protein